MYHAFLSSVYSGIREHRSSFVVYSILRILIVVTMIRQIMLSNYEGFFLCVLTLLLFYIPAIIKASFHVEIPPTLEIIVFFFIFASEILGEINAFFIVIPFWDLILHTITGFLAAAVGFSLVTILNNNRNLQFSLSPLFLALVGFCFSMTIGVVWEFFEFGSDWLLHTDMQKDSVIHSIYSVTLDPSQSNKVIGITGIQNVIINGEDLGINGYLDIGLIDTIGDLAVNFIGAFIFSIYGYFYSKSKGEKDPIVSRLILTPNDEQTDKKEAELLEIQTGK